ncbi:Rho1 guanine nucleotide exchange factor 2 [Schizosaccharomyces japonicus yFS275]|uniref:Rho1 guanine nucleotide exchange factor 2 n=1 Tax=Schizosaccharomyces japonicus (strain yFS275 / FY16936) TaxID=402676 RepID=B6K7Q5_SCHJY|nr:Rho1 guanine nucleotide exchange factor 2 [Schizosaccharomyces japonicus yFS275]EEB09559.1 Rho1 guanine nucleotide exchange factor 2 [Schizosaccharomyces japonicus yFS275]
MVKEDCAYPQNALTSRRPDASSKGGGLRFFSAFGSVGHKLSFKNSLFSSTSHSHRHHSQGNTMPQRPSTSFDLYLPGSRKEHRRQQRSFDEHNSDSTDSESVSDAASTRGTLRKTKTSYQESMPPIERGRSSDYVFESVNDKHGHGYHGTLRILSPSVSSRASQAAPLSAPLPGSASIYGHHHHSSSTNLSTTSVATRSKKSPIRPAFLSQVAQEFRRRVALGDRVKDSLLYKDAFTGAEAVEILLRIARTSDRTLALLLGRALDSQKFFHDVTYSHRLRDSAKEVYQFNRNVSTAPLSAISLFSPIETYHSTRRYPEQTETYEGVLSDFGLQTFGGTPPSPPVTHRNDAEDDLPHGVFTLLTECYSPTCSRNHLCYSVSCSRRLEQQARLNMKVQPILSGGASRLQDEQEQEDRLWVNTVPRHIVDQLDQREWKRQEVLFEVIYTERDFVRDLEYLRDFWIKPLRSSLIIPESRREKVVRSIFYNIMHVHAINSRLADALTRLQTLNPVVYSIGEVFVEYVPKFEPFIRYGANQLFGKYEYEREKSINTAFSQYVHEVERLRESRKLELNGYLTKPTTRLARYPLLLENVLKYTKDDNPDKELLPRVIEMIREFLTKLNHETGKAENRFALMQLDQQLLTKASEKTELQLMDPARKLIFKGTLRRKTSGSSYNDPGNELHVFLLDHALLLTKLKYNSKREKYKIFQRPIPLELLIVSVYEDYVPGKSMTRRPSSGILANPMSASKTNLVLPKTFALKLLLMGRDGFEIVLCSSTLITRDQWKQHIERQQELIRSKKFVFHSVVVYQDMFIGGNKVNCAITYDGGRKTLFGTNAGLFIANRRPGENTRSDPALCISLSSVSQVDVIEEYNILLILAEKSLYQASLDVIGLEPHAATRHVQRITNKVSFFKTGFCLQKILVCVAKSTVLNTSLKIFEVEQSKKMQSSKKAGGNQGTLKIFTELHMPLEALSVHFMKSALCVGTPKGFDVVSPKSAVFQSLLNPADTSFRFMEKENVRPISVFRLHGEFLLCYTECAFFVNSNGWKTRQNWFVTWKGCPEKFALVYPYVIAFEPTFIEVRHAETAELVQVIPGNNIHLLTDGRGLISEGGEILYVTEGKSLHEPEDDSVICSLTLENVAGSRPSTKQSQANKQ